MSAPLTSRLRLSDVLVLGVHGLKAHPMRIVLSSLGIAIGIAAMVAVIGISSSSQALVQRELASLGTNLLTVTSGEDAFGKETSLPSNSVAAVRRIEGVDSASSTSTIKNVPLLRNAEVPKSHSGGFTVVAADVNLLEATSATLLSGTWLNSATIELPAVVLGFDTAQRLGLNAPGALVDVGGNTLSVVGILNRSPLAPELDMSALIGEPVAASMFGYDGAPTTIYQRSADSEVNRIRQLVPATINPEAPNEVLVSRPSDALAAKNTVDLAFTGLLVGVGSIALLVGGIGVANTMVISVLERRREIGLRRALGATRRHIKAQFLVEAMLLAAYGGIAGVTLGWFITAIVSRSNGWLTDIPGEVLVAGVGATVAIGAVAGVVPAVRAARTPPTAALNS